MVSPANIERELEALFAPWDRTDAPGLVVGVRWAGRTLLRRGFGMASLETGVANTPATRMRIGSTSKHFTALLALLLAEQGLFDLDAPISRYIPDPMNASGGATVRQLLQHRGGSRCHLDLGFLGHGMLAPPPGAALAVLTRQAGRNFAPGEAMIYNNGGYHLMSLALAQVGGAPLAELMNERLFRPLGLSDTELAPTDYVTIPRMATLHVALEDGRWGRGLFPSQEILGEGGIVSTVDDMLTWVGHLRARDRLGSSETWDQLTAPPETPEPIPGHYALGLIVSPYRGLATLRHAGGVVGGASEMLSFPEHELDIIVLSNGAPNAVPSDLANAVADIVLEGELGPPEAVARASDYKAWLGDYLSTSGMLYELEDAQGQLRVRVANYAASYPLTPTPDGTLVTGHTGLSAIRLTLAESAGATSVTVAFGRERAVFSRLDPFSPTTKPPILDRYVCADAGFEAHIVSCHDQLILRMRDAYGCAEFGLTFVSERAAKARSLRSGDVTTGVLFFPPEEDFRMFRFNTARTRGLSFRRI